MRDIPWFLSVQAIPEILASRNYPRIKKKDVVSFPSNERNDMAHFFSWWSVSSSLALSAWRTLQKNQNQAKSYVGIVTTHPRTVFAVLAGRSLFTVISLYTEQRHYTRAREFLFKTYSRSLWTVWTGRASLSWRARKSRRTNLSGHAFRPRSTLNAINL